MKKTGFLSRNLFLLGLASFLTDVSSEMIYPLLAPFLITTLGASPAILGVIEGIAEATASLLRVFSGYWSDLMGRRKPWAVGGYACSLLGRGALYLAQGWGLVLTGRVIDRFGKGIRTAPRDALIAESVPPEQLGRGFGFHRTMDTLGAVCGVSLAYMFLSWQEVSSNLRGLFLISIVPALLGVFALMAVREPRKLVAVPTPSLPKGSRFTLRQGWLAWRGLPAPLRWFLGLTFLFTLGNSSNQFLLLRASDLGFDLKGVVLLYLMFNVTSSLVSYPAGRHSDRWGRRGMLVWGTMLYGMVYFGFGALTWLSLNDSHTRGLVWTLFALYGVYHGATDGVEKALIADMAPAERKATVLGLHAMLKGIGLLPASALAGILWSSVGPHAPFYFGGALALLTAWGLRRIL